MDIGGSNAANVSIIGDIGVLAGALAPINEDARGSLTIEASNDVDIAFINVLPNVVAQSLAGDPAVRVQLTSADINAVLFDEDGLPLDPPYSVELGASFPGSFYGAEIVVAFSGDATLSQCLLAGLCVPIVADVVADVTAVLVATLTGTVSVEIPPDITGTTGVAGEVTLGEIATAAGGEAVDFFSTGTGGFVVDSSGNVTFSRRAPVPGSTDACGIVISCGESGGTTDGDEDDT